MLRHLPLFLFILLLIPCTTIAQQNDTAIDSMRKLRARTKSGISYNEYTNEIANVAFALEKYSDTIKSKKDKIILDKLIDSFNAYEMAKDMWSLKFKSGHVVNSFQIAAPFNETFSVTKTLFSKYPELNSQYGNGGVIMPVKENEHEWIAFDVVISRLWSIGSSKLDAAIEYYKTNTPVKK